MTGLTLFFEFFKVGLFCFGGAFGMIPLIRDVVLAHEWMTESQFYAFLGICESTPGPIAVNLATYIGYTQGGIWGSILAVIGVALPSFIIILLIASILKNITENRIFKSVMSGIRPVVAALIMHAGISFLVSALNLFSEGEVETSNIITLLIISALYFIIRRLCGKKLSSVSVIAVSALLGVAVRIFRDYTNI
jgi:chromate transporter